VVVDERAVVVGSLAIGVAPVEILVLRIDELRRPLADRAAGDRADSGASDHAERSADRPRRRASDRTAAGADAGAEMVMGKFVVGLRVHHLARALAGETAGSRADRRPGGHSHRPGHRSCRRAGDGTAAGTEARREVVVGEIVVAVRIDDFGGALPGRTAGGGADRRTRDGADRTGDGPGGSAGERSCARADAGAELVLARLAAF